MFIKFQTLTHVADTAIYINPSEIAAIEHRGNTNETPRYCLIHLKGGEKITVGHTEQDVIAKLQAVSAREVVYDASTSN